MAGRLGAEATVAADLLLACALEDLRGWTGPVALAPAEDEDARWLETAGHGGHDCVLQRGATLGERINHVDAALRARGRSRLLFIGADCPALDRAYLERAVAALEHADAVLGPAADGGVVLMGARRPWPPIGDLAWSTPALLNGLRGRLRGRGWTVESLGTLPDVDSADDLLAAGALLADDARPARRALLAWLQTRSASPAEAP